VGDGITMFLCGDVMLGRGIDQILPEPCDPALHEPYVRDAREYIKLAQQASGPIPRAVDPAYPWGDALAILDAAVPDARVINLETSITRSSERDRDKRIHYRVSPENARCLATAQIDACVLANNHVLDWGRRGLADTLDTLDRMGIARCGAGGDLDEAIRPAVIDRGERGRVIVFSLGCTDAGVPDAWAVAPDRPGVRVASSLDDAEVRRLRHAIAPWRTAGSAIVVSIHWGENWDFEVPREHRRFAHRLIDDAGAHVVHGHSSHHVKGIEVHAGQPILYGCGDLLTDYEGIQGYERFRGDLGLVYLLSVDSAGALVRLEMIPTRVRRFRIARASGEHARWLASTLTRCGEPFGTSVEIDGDRLLLKW
jgi:poly-gamma-glutamate synthesis protein (capsule biosynthesis protein)